MNESNEQKPDFDLAQAKTMVNKRVLIGLSYYDHTGKFIEQKQMHGIVTNVGHNGFIVNLEGSNDGKTYQLPPDLRSFREAAPGTYREHSTGDEIIDPDYLVTWAVTKPAPEWKK